jgi:hypothetical protein
MEHKLSDSVCFLCGCDLNSENRSDEHVVPRWVQDRFNLWNQRLTLLNGTTIAYRQLKIPCCCVCNNEALSRVENEVRQAVELGVEAVSDLDSRTLFVWLGKIFFGLLYRELFLRADLTRPDSAPIVTADQLSSYQMHHYFLQSCRVPMEFDSMDAERPWTIYVFNLQSFNRNPYDWDIKDDVNYATLSLRMGQLGFLAAFDGGAIALDSGESFSRFNEHPLHPVQFDELTAAFFYKASLFTRTPKFIVAESPGSYRVTLMPIAGLSTKPVFGEWQPENFAQVFSFFSGIPLEKIYPEQGRMLTLLRDADGEFCHIDLREHPYRGVTPEI